MVCLLRARDRNPTEENKQSCDKLWKAICLAEGFRGKFPKWCVLNLGCPFPQLFPALEQCLEIASVFQDYFTGVDAEIKSQKLVEIRKRSDLDWKRGEGHLPLHQ